MTSHRIIRISSTSREYVRVPVSASEAGVVQNPTGDTVEFSAVTPGAEPSTWTAGTWETDATTDPDSYYARILISGTGGGGTLAMADGTYDLWVRITDSPERPARPVCRLVIT